MGHYGDIDMQPGVEEDVNNVEDSTKGPSDSLSMAAEVVCCELNSETCSGVKQAFGDVVFSVDPGVSVEVVMMQAKVIHILCGE